MMSFSCNFCCNAVVIPATILISSLNFLTIQCFGSRTLLMRVFLGICILLGFTPFPDYYNLCSKSIGLW